MRRALSGFLVSAVVALGTPATAEACSCAGPGPPCEEVWEAPLVFAGTVTAITLLGAESYGPKRVTFAVSEAFRGDDLEEIVIVLPGTSCDYRFEVGESYVVYGRHAQSGPGWTTDICTRTGRSSERQEDLAYLRLPVDEQGHPRIIGRVMHDEAPLENVRVRASGPERHETRTGADGTYAIYVGAGRMYDVTFDDPPGLVIHGGSEVMVSEYRACKLVNGYARHDGRVTGRLVGSRGGPVPLFPLRLEAPHTVGLGDVALDAITGEDGTFEFGEVQPGSYRILVHGSAVSSTVSLVRTPIVIGPSTRVNTGTLTLPSTLRPTLIEVSVIDAAGVAVPGIAIDVSRPDIYEPLAGLQTDDNGRFAFSVSAGGRYVVTARRFGYDESGFFIEHASETVTAVGMKTVTLRLERTR